LFGFIQQAAQRAEKLHDDLIREHEQQKRQLEEVTEERDHLKQANSDLQA